MKKLSTIIAEALRLAANRIDEQAFYRAEILKRSDDLSDEILLHLGKIALNPDDENTNKHIKDVSVWIFKIALMKIKRGKQPKLSTLIIRGYVDNHGAVSKGLHILVQSQLDEYLTSHSKHLTSKFDDELSHFIKSLDSIDYSDIQKLHNNIRIHFIKNLQ